jgi:sugar O-acyltransferase (sialic acid O-acetyltransferase NeuD family)
MEKIFIYGAGGLGKEILDLLRQAEKYQSCHLYFVDSNKNLVGTKVAGIEVKHPKFFKPEFGSVVLAIGDPQVRRKVVNSLPDQTNYITLVHPSVVMGRSVSIGRGSVISAGSKISCDTVLGEFSHINFNCTLGHDCKIGSYFTAAPGVNISGNVFIGDEVYCGTQAAFKQGITIADNVIIGMSSSVIRSVSEEGVTVFGNPARVIIKSKNQ